MSGGGGRGRLLDVSPYTSFTRHPHSRLVRIPSARATLPTRSPHAVCAVAWLVTKAAIVINPSYHAPTSRRTPHGRQRADRNGLCVYVVHILGHCSGRCHHVNGGPRVTRWAL